MKRISEEQYYDAKYFSNFYDSLPNCRCEEWEQKAEIALRSHGKLKAKCRELEKALETANKTYKLTLRDIELAEQVEKLEAEAKMGNVPYRTAIKWKKALAEITTLRPYDDAHDAIIIAEKAIEEDG